MNDLAALRAFLPEILTNVPGALFFPVFDEERVIDLEWHRAKKDDDDEDPCGCGRDLPDGTLELIGVGNDQAVLQLDWLALNEDQKDEVRRGIYGLILRGVTVYHNADADIRKLREHVWSAITAAGHEHLDDTMLADAVLHSEESHKLGDVNRRYGRLPDFKHLKKAHPREYNAGDLVATYWIKRDQDRQFAQDPQAHHVYRTMSIPFIDLGIEGEEAGVRVDPKVAVDLYHKYGARVESARRLAWGYTGNPLMNLASPDAMKQWVHKVYGLPEQMPKNAKWDPEAGPTLGKDALATLRRHVGTEWDADEEPTLEAALAAIEAGGNGLLEAKYLFSGAQQRLTHYVLAAVEVVE